MADEPNPILAELDKHGFTEDLMAQLEKGWFGRQVLQRVVAEVRRLQKQVESMMPIQVTACCMHCKQPLAGDHFSKVPGVGDLCNPCHATWAKDRW